MNLKEVLELLLEQRARTTLEWLGKRIIRDYFLRDLVLGLGK